MRAVIIGAGGCGREARDWLLAAGVSDFLGFLDDGDPDPALLARIGAQHLGGIDRLADLDAAYYVGIGDPQIRHAVASRAHALGATPGPPIVHPTAVVGADVEIGEGSLVCPGVIVTTNVRIGEHVHLGVRTTVSHDCIVDDFVSLNPGATISGHVTVGARTMVGTNASTKQYLAIGSDVVVGAGACVIRDIRPSTVVVGVPARALSS